MKLRYILLLLLLAVPVFVVALFPVQPVFERFKIPEVSAKQVTGTFWKGAMQDMRIQKVKLDHADWRLAWQQVFRGRLGYWVTLKKNKSTLAGNVGKQYGEQGLEDVVLDGFVPDVIETIAEARQIFIPGFVTDGKIDGKFADIVLDSAYQLTDINGTASLHSLKVGLQAIKGQYDADITTIEGVTQANLSSSADADLRLSGYAKADQSGQYDVDITLASHADTPDGVMRLLNVIGFSKKGNSRHIKQKGRWK
jgi:hypothetical protein